MKSAIKVGRVRTSTVRYRARHRRQRGQVDDVVDAGEQRSNGFRVAYVHFVNFDARANCLKILSAAGTEIVQHADVVPTGD